MVIRHSRDLEGNTGAGLKERGKLNMVKTGRGFTTNKPGELNPSQEKDREGIIIAKKLYSVRKYLGKLLVGNKEEVLCVYLVNHIVEITN